MTACACGHCGHVFEGKPQGGQRLLCGDATNAQDIARLMDGLQADICFTSPPYAQQRDYKTGPQDWLALMKAVFAILPVKHDAQVLVNLGLVHRDNEWVPYWDGWIEWMRRAGWRRFGWYVWDQGPGLAGDWNGRLAPSHEFIFHFNRIAEKARKSKAKKPENIKVMVARGTHGGLRRKDGTINTRSNPAASLQETKIADSVVRVMRHKGGGLNHPAPFPIALVVEMIEAFSDPGDLAFEPFCGSGTQLLAAEANARRCCAIEIEPIYCDVAVKRWSNFTGRQAVRGDGQLFDELTAEGQAAA